MEREECTTLLRSYDIAAIGAAADEIRQPSSSDNIVTYIIDRNINYTNVLQRRLYVLRILSPARRARHVCAHDG